MSLTFKNNVVTASAAGLSPENDSGAPALGKSATGKIRSETFLVAPELKPGGIQELIHGNSALLTTPNGDIVVNVRGDWNRNIKQYENIIVNGNSTHEHDGSLFAEFSPPGSLTNTYMNGDVRRYYLNGHFLLIDQTVTETIGLGSTGSDITLSTLRFGDDQITVKAPNSSDTVTIYGDSTSVHVGSKNETTSARVTSFTRGMHFESFNDSSKNSDQSSELAKTYSTETQTVAAGLAGISKTFQNGFTGLAASDPNRLPKWNTPPSSDNFQIKTLIFPGANLNFKLTAEFTYATLRTAVSMFGGSFRAYHCFVNGWHPVLVGLKAGVDALHTHFRNLCGRVYGIAFGNPRAPVPTPPTPAALEVAAEEAAAEAASTSAAATAAGEAVEAAEVAEQAAQTALGDAAAKQTAAQAVVDNAAGELTTAEQAVTQAEQQLAKTAPAVTQAETDVAAAAGKVPPAETALDEAQAAFDPAEARLNTATQGLEDAQAELDAAKPAFDRASADLTTAQEAFDSAEAEVGEAQNAVTQARALLAAAQTPEEEAAAQAALEDAESRLTTAAGKLPSAQTALDEAQAAFDPAEARLNTAQQSFNSARTELTNAQTAFDSAETRLNSATQSFKTAQTQLQDAQTALKTAKAQEAAAQQAVRNAAAQKTGAQEALNKANAQLDQAKDAVAKATSKVGEAEQGVIDANADKADAQAAAARAKAANKAAQEEAIKAGVPVRRTLPIAGGPATHATDHPIGPKSPWQK